MAKHTTTILASLLIIALFAGSAMAGGWAAKADTGSNLLVSRAWTHTKAFQPDPKSLVAEDNRVTAADFARKTKNTVSGGNRYNYRAGFTSTGTVQNYNLNIGGKLGTAWPKTLYNANAGKGREISSIMK